MANPNSTTNPQNPESGRSEVVRPRILIVDDERSTLEALEGLLKDDGRDVTVTTDPIEACALVTSERFDVALCDLRMRSRDGIEVLRHIRKHSPHTRTVLFTGHATLESAVDALHLGASDYLLKPVTFDKLNESIDRALSELKAEGSRETLVQDLFSSNDDLQRSVEELNALYESSIRLSATRDVPSLLENILALATRVTGASMGSIMLIDQSGERLRIAAAQGLDSKIIHEVRQPLGESISGYVAKSGEALLIKNVEEDNRFQRPSRERYGNASLVCVPLLVSGRVLGVINISRKSDGGVFTERDLRLLTMFASLSAVAIDDARQFEEKSRQLKELKVIHELTLNILSVGSQKETIDLIYGALQKITPVEFLLWLKHDPRTHTLSILEATGRELGMSDSGKIALDSHTYKEPVIDHIDGSALEGSNPTAVDKYVCDRLADLGIKDIKKDAFLVAPVKRDGAVTYLFCIGTRYLESYSAHERSLVEIVVSQAALLFEKEKALLNASRLLTMGNMISEISHDLRKPLTAIRGSVGLLKKKLREGADCSEVMQLIEDESNRLNELVAELVDFSKPNKYEAEKTDLRHLVIRALELVAPDLDKRKITTQIHFDETDWQVIVNKNQVFEALLNLLMNAVDAMSEGGALTITGKIDKPDYKNQNYLALSVTDTGIGMQKSDISRVFDRYFTTKETGTGLGLAVVERVMSAHDGAVAVESEPGVGSTFTLYFPIETPS